MRIFSLALVGLLILCAASTVQAHRVNVFAWVEGDTIHVESEFSRGNPVKGGGVEVRRADSGDVLVAGQTDDAGLFAFQVPESALADPADLEVEVNAGQGHRSSWIVRTQDYAGSGVDPAERSAAQPASETLESIAANDRSMQTAALDAEAVEALQLRIEHVVEQKLDEKLTPLVRAVNRIQEDAGPSVSDIFGGIGYLIGLAGLVAYFKSRRRQ